MACYRSAAGLAINALLVLTTSVAAIPGVAAAEGTATSSAIEALADSPCVHRGITFFCGSVPASGGPVVTTLEFSFGDPTDLPVFGDWDGDGNRTAAVFRPALGTWYLANTDDASDPPQVVNFGDPGDIPLAGNWFSLDTETIAVYRPSDATFYLRATNTSGTADQVIPFGNPGDIPLAGDFDLTGITRIGVYRPATATFYFSHGPRSPYAPVTSTTFGDPGDRPLAGNYWCGAVQPLQKIFAVFRPSNGTWYGLCAGAAHNATNATFQYGDPSDLPLLK